MIGAGMTLGGSDVADRAVPMFVIIPMHEAPGPIASSVEIAETPLRELRGGIERCGTMPCVGIVVTDAWTRMR